MITSSAGMVQMECGLKVLKGVRDCVSELPIGTNREQLFGSASKNGSGRERGRRTPEGRQ